MRDPVGTTRMRPGAVNLRLIKGVLTLMALGYVVAQVQPAAILAALTGALPGWLTGALLLLPANLLVAAARWHTALPCVVPDRSFRQALGAVLCGRTLGFVTPARIGDYAGRALFLKHPNRPALLTLAVAEQLPGLLVFLTAGTGALLYGSQHHHVLHLADWGVPLALAGLVGLGTLLLLFPPAVLLPWLQRKVRMPWLADACNTLHRLTPQTITRLLGWSVLHYAVFTTQFFCLLKAFAPDTTVAEGFTGIALVFLVKSLVPPVTLMDLGVREGAAVLFLGLFGVPQPAAFNAAFLLFGCNLVLPALLGLPFAWHLLPTRQPTASQPLPTPSQLATGP